MEDDMGSAWKMTIKLEKKNISAQLTTVSMIGVPALINTDIL